MRRNLTSRLKEFPLDLVILVVVGVVSMAFFVLAVVEGAWLAAVIFGLISLGEVLVIFWTRNMTRGLDKLIGELPDVPEREPTEAMLAVDAFDEAIHDAYGVPLTDQVRLDRAKAERLLERLRTALPRGPSTLSALFYELDELIRGPSRSRSPTGSASTVTRSTTFSTECARASRTNAGETQAPVIAGETFEGSLGSRRRRRHSAMTPQMSSSTPSANGSTNPAWFGQEMVLGSCGTA